MNFKTYITVQAKCALICMISQQRKRTIQIIISNHNTNAHQHAHNKQTNNNNKTTRIKRAMLYGQFGATRQRLQQIERRKQIPSLLQATRELISARNSNKYNNKDARRLRYLSIACVHTRYINSTRGTSFFQAYLLKSRG